MKQFAAGCLLTLLGLIAGLVIAFAAFTLLPSSRPEPAVTAVGQPDVTISFSAHYVGAQAQQAVKQSGLASSATTTLAAPDLIRISAPVDASSFGLPLTVDATITLRVGVQQGRVVLTVAGAGAGGIPVTQDTFGPVLERLRSSAEQEINAEVQSGLKGTGLAVGDIRVTSVEMTVDLVTQ
ncbi:MAG: hypothetical protein M1482_12220 [Chloroflexi bacterium]|nr:hypothetical protein [Chloroflexota bacterium]